MKSIQQRLLTSLLIGLPLLWLLTSSVVAWRLWHEINEMNDTQITQVARYLLGVSGDDDLEGDYLKKVQKSKKYDKEHHQEDSKEEGHQKKEQEIDEEKDHHDDDDHKYAKIYNLKSKQLSGDLGEAEDDYMGFAIWDKNGRLLMADENGQSFAFLPKQHGFLEEDHHAYQRLNPFSRQWRLFYVHDEHSHQHEGRIIAVGQNLESRQEMIIDGLMVQILPMLMGLLAFIGLVIWSVRRGFAPLTQLSGELTQRQPQDDSPISADVPKEIQPLVTALNTLFVKVAETLAREQRFTADASHELRSPLTALKLQADLLQQQLLQTANLENESQLYYHAQKISEGIDRANHLVEQLLTLAKLAPEQGLPHSELEPVDWLALTDEVLGEVNLLAREKSIQLKRTLVCEQTCDILPIAVNATLITLLIRNLLDNAIRYCPEGSTIELQLSEDAIRVLDNGRGVAPEQLARLSERFYRPAGQNQLGSGLGLSIVHRIAELHGLQLSFANRAKPDIGFIATVKRSVNNPLG